MEPTTLLAIASGALGIAHALYGRWRRSAIFVVAGLALAAAPPVLLGRFDPRIVGGACLALAVLPWLVTMLRRRPG